MQKSVSQQPLSSIKEGWEQQTSNKFEASEQFHLIPAFQNGGTEFTTKYGLEGGLHVLQIRVIIYLDNMLLMSQTLEELLMSRDTIIFLPTQLGFVINLKKSVLVPIQQIEILGLEK